MMLLPWHQLSARSSATGSVVSTITGTLIFRHECRVERIDVDGFVAVGRLEADVDNLRTVLDLPSGDFTGLVPLLLGDRLREQPRTGGVGPLADNQRAIALFRFHELDTGVVGATRRFVHTVRWMIGCHLRESSDVCRRCAAAAANDVQPAVPNESLELSGEELRRLWILPIVVWKPGVRMAGDPRRGHLGERPQRIGHQLGSGRAIETDRDEIHVGDRDVEGVDRLAGQHRAPRARWWPRTISGIRWSRSRSSFCMASRPGLEVPRIESGFEEQEIDATFHERFRLTVIAVAQFSEGDVAAKRQRLRRRSDGAGDESRFRGRRELVGRLPRQPGRGTIQIVRLPLETELCQHD